jgi:predicted ribosomally synthesized peptide with nif11-like leader
MPIDDVARFVAALKADKQLQSEVKASGGDLRSLVTLANRHGYRVTEDAVETYLTTHRAAIHDEQLDAVVGGVLKGKKPVEGIGGAFSIG